MKDLNLIPKSYIEAKRKKLKKIYSTFAIVGIFLLLALMVVFPLAIRLKLQFQRDGLDREIKKTSNYLSIESQINAINDLYKQREDEGNKLRSYGLDSRTIFDGIEKALPEKLFITSFSASDAKSSEVQVTLEGVAISDDEIATFVNYMRQNSLFENVVISSVKKVASSVASLSLTSVMGKSAGVKSNTPVPDKSTAPNTATPAPGNGIIQAAAKNGEDIQGDTNYSFSITIYLKAGK